MELFKKTNIHFYSTLSSIDVYLFKIFSCAVRKCIKARCKIKDCYSDISHIIFRHRLRYCLLLTRIKPPSMLYYRRKQSLKVIS